MWVVYLQVSMLHMTGQATTKLFRLFLSQGLMCICQLAQVILTTNKHVGASPTGIAGLRALWTHINEEEEEPDADDLLLKVYAIHM